MAISIVNPSNVQETFILIPNLACFSSTSTTQDAIPEGGIVGVGAGVATVTDSVPQKTPVKNI
ncbi:MAG: hypothetical protein ABJQ90_12180 [Parasphingorhabdus sp.]